ncbi:MAG: HEAT repeat domain-containing protein [Gemmatimonadaceae bacterium]
MSSSRILCALLLLAPAVSSAQSTACSNDADDVRRAALVGIMQMESSQILPVLEKLLERRDDCSVSLRRQAVELLARTREPERLDIMVRVARTDPSGVVRRQAVQSIAQVNTERSAALLDSIFASATDTDVSEMALRGLAQQTSPAARTALRRIAESTTLTTEIRVRAVNQIGSGRRTPEDIQYLKDLYGKTTSQQLREGILRSVSYQRSTESLNWLLGVARDRNSEIELRQVALRSAGQYWDRGNSAGLEVKDLLALYDEFKSQPEMQDQMLDVLAQRPESAATDKLIQIASDGENMQLRRRAIQRLAQRRDPRVRQFLLDVVSR